MKLYKLTTQDNKTRVGQENETLWGENVTHKTEGNGLELCTANCIHAYSNPIIALIMNPHHANITNPKLWECEGEITVTDYGLKCGVKKLTTLKEISYEKLSLNTLVRFSQQCSKLADEYVRAYTAADAAANAVTVADAVAHAAYAAVAAAAAGASATYAAKMVAAAAAYAANAAAYAANAAAHAAAAVDSAADSASYTAVAAAAAANTAKAVAKAAAAKFEREIIAIAEWAVTNKTEDEL